MSIPTVTISKSNTKPIVEYNNNDAQAFEQYTVSYFDSDGNEFPEETAYNEPLKTLKVNNPYVSVNDIPTTVQIADEYIAKNAKTIKVGVESPINVMFCLG